MTYENEKWCFCVDRGGTFTDIIGLLNGRIVFFDKLLSESTKYPDAVIEGIRRALDIKSGDIVDGKYISFLRVGTTVATNALLQRKGEPTALLMTHGFGDLLEIGYQDRPNIFALCINKSEPLYSRVIQIEERMDASGNILRPLNRTKLEMDLHSLKDSGIKSVAIVLMHSWKNPLHEIIAAEIAEKVGFEQISVSGEIMPLIKIVPRGQTTLVDAYLNPVLRKYVKRLQNQTENVSFMFMKSSGGLTSTENFTGKDAIFSGPAGGVVGCAAVAKECAISEAIGFDMGGTSTDVSRYDGAFERAFNASVSGITFNTEMLDVRTIASGGGSVLSFDGHKLLVGSESAGAMPGPACYGYGGPLTLTDANLVLGKILPDRFPATFGSRGQESLCADRSIDRFKIIAAKMEGEFSKSMTIHQIAQGFIRIANEKMCGPIKEITLSKGRDVRTHALIAFGGAAPQHACAIAEILDIDTVIVPRLCGLLSAYGIAASDHVRTSQKAVMSILNPESFEGYSHLYDEMADPLVKEMHDLGVEASDVSQRRTLDLRPLGSESFLNVSFGKFPQIVENFQKEYVRHFGFIPDKGPIEVVALRIEISGRASLLKSMDIVIHEQTRIDKPQASSTTEVWFSNEPVEIPVYERNSLRVGDKIVGPAIIAEDHATTVVDPRFKATVNQFGHLVMRCVEKNIERSFVQRDPVMLEVFNNLFMGIAEQMGITLSQTAHSTNIKERLDFSCAVFDEDGRLVANAPHIPVHLGAIGDTVRSVWKQHHRNMHPGDVYVSNNPIDGGSHLPDLTVVSPIFDHDGNLMFFSANRGHHSDIGGKWPGSMFPDARCLEDEGIVLSNVLLVRNGQLLEDRIRRILESGPWPARNISERLGDLRAQIAANNCGIKELRLLIDKYGLEMVKAYMGHIQTNAADALGQALDSFLGDHKIFDSKFEDVLDDGSKISVRLIIRKASNARDQKRVTVDFQGTGSQNHGNLNAPIAVSRAAVLYVFRTLVGKNIPLNEGCWEHIELLIPKGCLLNPSPTAAVAAGNVETSQRIVDVLYGALGIAAASQGTMNNFLFGRSDGLGGQYYETIAGGAGGVEGCPGASAVHTHMTNTRITDSEVLEYRYPWVRLNEFSIRRGSGGKGRYPGGDGVVRKMEFLQECRASIISQRRITEPFGLMGGSPGMSGRNNLKDANGALKNLEYSANFNIKSGQSVVIETPGGGGFGKEK